MSAEYLLPLTQPLHIPRRTIPQPAIELGGFFELLAAHAGDDDEAAVKFGERGHIAPGLFELGEGGNILLTFAPAFFHVFSGDVRRYAGGASQFYSCCRSYLKFRRRASPASTAHTCLFVILRLIINPIY